MYALFKDHFVYFRVFLVASHHYHIIAIYRPRFIVRLLQDDHRCIPTGFPHISLVSLIYIYIQFTSRWDSDRELLLRQHRTRTSQVAQLSLTNPCDALHHDKRQNFKSHVTITTPLLWVLYHPVARFDIAYLCTKFDDFRFSLSSDMIGTPKTDHMTWLRPYQGRFLFGRLWLAHSTCISYL